MHMPGLYVAVPSTPYDAKGLLKRSLRGKNPVIFLEHKRLYGIKGHIPTEDYSISFGRADIKREERDVTVVAIAFMVQRALEAAKSLKRKGVSVEVIDPQTVVPLDRTAILNSVKKTGRLVVVDEDTKTVGAAAEIATIVAEEGFEHLHTPIGRVTTQEGPVPASPQLEVRFVPQVKNIMTAIEEIL